MTRLKSFRRFIMGQFRKRGWFFFWILYQHDWLPRQKGNNCTCYTISSPTYRRWCQLCVNYCNLAVGRCWKPEGSYRYVIVGIWVSNWKHGYRWPERESVTEETKWEYTSIETSEELEYMVGAGTDYIWLGDRLLLFAIPAVWYHVLTSNKARESDNQLTYWGVGMNLYRLQSWVRRHTSVQSTTPSKHEVRGMPRNHSSGSGAYFLFLTP